DSGWKIVYEPSAAVYHSDNHDLIPLFQRYFDLGVVLKRLGMWDEATKSSLFRDGWRLLRRKLAVRSGNGRQRSDRLNSILQDTAKYAGMKLGKNEGLLPLSIKRRMSGVGIFN
ncbi:MAG: hypothetical protein ACRD4E_16285, partial [Bryobacteraceae bacterium]